MPSLSHIHVRSLEIGDFGFVQSLASRQTHFTIPPTYVLWLILRIRDAVCLIADDSAQGPLAYLLALPVKAPENSIFVWQLAASEGPQREEATLELLTEFRNILKKAEIKRIVFSTIPASPSFRVIQRFAWKVFSSVPKAMNALPVGVSREETEFVLDLKGAGSSSRHNKHGY